MAVSWFAELASVASLALIASCTPFGEEPSVAPDASVEAAAGSADGGAVVGFGSPREGGAPANEKVIFATSTTYDGNLGGIAGADQKCAAHAAASTRARVRQSTFVAWLSAGAISPATRPSAGAPRYVLATNAVVADSWADLTDGSIKSAVSVDENGAPVSGQQVWTGTHEDGKAEGKPTCELWTSAAAGTTGFGGDTSSTAAEWTDDATAPCSAAAHLYCVEQ